MTIGSPVDWLDDGDEVRLAANPSFSLRVLHTPGHTPDSVAYYSSADGCAFVGDAIIDGGIGITKFPGGDYVALVHSLQTRILTLPQKTMLLSGHSEPIAVAAFPARR